MLSTRLSEGICKPINPPNLAGDRVNPIQFSLGIDLVSEVLSILFADLVHMNTQILTGFFPPIVINTKPGIQCWSPH
jgi:hypothetical protein